MLLALLALIGSAWACPFTSLDANKDGALVASELAAAMGPGTPEAAGRDLLVMFDIDGSASWSKTECGSWSTSLSKGPLAIPASAFAQSPSSRAISDRAFADMDANGDGSIGVSEADPAMIGALDVNRDQKLSADEMWTGTVLTMDFAPSRQSFVGLAGVADQGADGVWKKDELERVVRLAPSDLGATVDTLLAHDADGNGSLSQAELDAWFAGAARRLMHASADTSGDGKLDEGEIAAGFNIIVGEAKGIIKQYDGNRDGLEVSELMAWRAKVAP